MMITGRLRALAVLMAALRAPSSKVSRLPMRVRLTDVDLNVHLTNSRYPQLMDLGRLDWLVRAGLGRAMVAERFRAIAVEVRTEFRRELKLGQAFVLDTRVVGFDRKAAIFEQRFLVDGVVFALGTVKVLCVADGTVVAPTAFEASLQPWDQFQGSEARAVQ